MKAIFLDRDGVLNPYMPEDYIKSPSQWQFLEYSLEALKKLSYAGYTIFVVTNQSCINRKYVAYRSVFATHDKIIQLLTQKNIRNVHFSVCFHHPEDHCNCRKPKPGMLETICNTYHLNPREYWFIGDSPSDIEAGKQCGLNVAALLTGNPKMITYTNQQSIQSFPNLLDAVNSLLFSPFAKKEKLK